MTILRYLMATPATLTQLGDKMGQSPAWVRHHVKILEEAGWIFVSEVRVSAGVNEKYYKARASALLLQELILPNTSKPYIIFSGSHDNAIERIAAKLSRHLTLFVLPVGSLDGLINLRQYLCHISGTHILNDDGADYNTESVRHIFPDRNMVLVTMAHRTQGMIIAPGNPKGIRTIEDLLNPEIQFINRNPGSGTRMWVDRELANLGLPTTEISEYGYYVSTHSEAARMVKQGTADAAIGIQSAAIDAGTDFIPLFEERYDLVFERSNMRVVAPIIEYLRTPAFRKELNALSGYNTAHSGELVPVQ